MFSRQQFKALDRVSLTIEPGETLGLLGESGCGKSTLARTMLGLTTPSSGKVFFKEHEILTVNRKLDKNIRGKMQILFQHPESALNPRMKIYDSLIEPLVIQKKITNKKKTISKISELMDRVGLNNELLKRYPHELSGGQIQRVVLARILSLQPEFIVADEPTSMLDVSVQAQVLHMLKDIQNQYGIGYLFISHDLELVSWMSDRIAVMYKGQIVESGYSDEICNNPCHPYTTLLVNAFLLFKSNLDAENGSSGGDIKISKSESIFADRLFTGCSYASRCPNAGPTCHKKPELREIADRHYVACWQA
ncbi:MAG: ABC transporter ATP-binding protein [Eubacteriales bacterium]